MRANTGELRLRIFAGPNGSGKSLIIDEVRNTVINGFPLDVGIYINADEIAKSLSKGIFNFNEYKVNVTKQPLLKFVEASGLLNSKFTIGEVQKSISIYNGQVKLKNVLYIDQIAQIFARYLRELMLEKRKRFSFETVFSHESNIDFMQRAEKNGYKVYLYFVATENPEINKYRVKLRVKKGGHDVPENKIEPRYYRSLELLYEASNFAYQAYFFDNTHTPHLVNHFKVIDGKKKWDTQNSRKFPSWFKKYYWNKDA